MHDQDLKILNSFIKAPVLKINSEKYPFENFEFYQEEFFKTSFNFPKHLVLGMQAEACFEAYIINSKNYTLLAANLQINGEKETLGELDYIIENHNTHIIEHIELACKFYLYDTAAGVSEEEKWIGPNRKDRLSEKLEKVRLKQFPLLQKKETLQKLHDLKIELPTSQKLCLKAFLFLPKKTKSIEFAGNFRDCIIGYYIKNSDFNKEDENAAYAIPTKKEWLLPINSVETWYSFTEVKKKIELQISNKKSPLIYKKTLHQIERFFVVWW